MPRSARILATAGHVDHGKSALVKALSGIDPDRLPEEKARGITIDLGFAHLLLEAPAVQGEPVQFHVGIVDVPGHEDFVKNMVAGVGSVDLALLVVAADDGWMPQTQEHLQILLFLGVMRAVIAMTKADLVTPGREQLLAEEIRQRLAGTPFAESPIIATAITTGRGLEQLKQSIVRCLLETPAPRDVGRPRLAVDRAFVLRGVGTVVTGTLAGGTLSRGQSVVIQPAGQAAKIRSMQNHNREIEKAAPGARIALSLPDLHVANSESAAGKPQVGRGDIVTIAGIGTPTQTVDVLLFRGDQVTPDNVSGRDIRNGTRVRLHYGSANVAARLVFHGDKNPPSDVRALAQLRLERPAFLLAGDRFILRDWPERQTLAGGYVLDPAARPRDRRAPGRADWLLSLYRAGDDIQSWLMAMLSAKGILDRARLMTHARFSETQISEALASLARQNRIALPADFVATSAWWRQRLQHAMTAIDAEHRDSPQRVGLALTDLRAALKSEIARKEGLFDAIVAELTRQGFEQNGAAVRRASHRPALPKELSAAGETIRAALRNRPLDPPSRKELAPTSVSFQALKFLLQTGEAVDVGPELVLGNDAYQDAVGKVRQHIRTHGPATVSELKQLLSTSRRVMVPLLEKLDREGFTRRIGDQRVLKT